MLCKWKKYDKTSSEFFTAWVSDPVKFPEKGLGTMAAIWPSTERVDMVTTCTQDHLDCDVIKCSALATLDTLMTVHVLLASIPTCAHLAAYAVHNSLIYLYTNVCCCQTSHCLQSVFLTHDMMMHFTNKCPQIILECAFNYSFFCWREYFFVIKKWEDNLDESEPRVIS
jgi:hypothetical protein